MTISQILRTYGKQFTQIQMRYFDGQEGKYAIGVIGWWNETPRSKDITSSVQIRIYSHTID